MAYIDDEDEIESDAEGFAPSLPGRASPDSEALLESRLRDLVMSKPTAFTGAVKSARDRITQMLNRESRIEPQDILRAGLSALAKRGSYADELKGAVGMRTAMEGNDLQKAKLVYDLERTDVADRRAESQGRTQEANVLLRYLDQMRKSRDARQARFVKAAELSVGKHNTEGLLYVLGALRKEKDADAILDSAEAQWNWLAQVAPGAPKAKPKPLSPKGKEKVDLATGLLTPDDLVEKDKPPPGYEAGDGGKLRFKEGGPADPAVIQKQWEARQSGLTAAQRGELQKLTSDLERGEQLTDRLIAMVDQNPSAFGTWGDVRQFGSRASAALGDIIGMPEGMNWLRSQLGALVKDDPTLDQRDVLQMELVGLLSKSLVGRGGRDLRAAYEEAKSIANLGGISGAGNIKRKLEQIKREFSTRRGELMTQPITSPEVPMAPKLLDDPLGIR